MKGPGFQVDAVIQELRNALAATKLVGRSSAFLAAVAHLVPVARSGATVLVTGETGVGKELIARAIHYLSVRASYPFVAVNCGALTDTLIEAELFGHEKGAFTGAYVSRRGLVAAAEKGTVFLDEVDGLSWRGQVALLRLLQDKVYRPVGSTVEIHADVRMLAASNIDLERHTAAGDFRSDLYYRLCVFRIHLPALRDRPEDIPLMAEHFLRKHAVQDGSILRISAAAHQALLAYGWPGNVRELENSLIRAVHLCRSNVIEPADLGLPVLLPAEPPEALSSFNEMKRRAIERFEREYLARVLSEHGGNITQAARAAQKERRDFGKLVKKHRIDVKSVTVDRVRGAAAG